MDTPTRTLSRIARDEKLVQLIGDLPLAEDEVCIILSYLLTLGILRQYC